MKWEGKIQVLELSNLQDSLSGIEIAIINMKLKLSFKSHSHYIWIFYFIPGESIFFFLSELVLFYFNYYLALFPEVIILFITCSRL